MEDSTPVQGALAIQQSRRAEVVNRLKTIEGLKATGRLDANLRRVG